MDQDSKVCPQCAEIVKSAAKVCRYCRYEFPAEQQHGDAVADGSTITATVAPATTSEPFFTKEVTLGLLAFLIIGPLLVWGFMYLIDQDQRTDRPDHEETAKRYITKDFLDPGSAQFRNLYSSDRCVTGDVNGKNSFGAFIGFKDFYYDVYKGTGRTVPAEFTDPLFVNLDGYKKSIAEREKYDFERSVCMNGEEEAKRSRAEVNRMVADDEKRRAERKKKRREAAQ